MDITSLLIALVIGAVAGFLAGQVVKGHGFGLVGNIIVGVLGSVVFNWLFTRFALFGAENGILNAIAGGTIGAVLLLLVIGFLKKAA